MQWLTREPERRADPRIVLSGARSIIVAGLNYWQPQPKGRGRIARYALGEDYHHILLEKLEALAAEIAGAGAMAKVYVDTGPVLEKPLAERAGVGWQGKSTMLINTKLGPWLLLGEIITTLELEPDAPQRDHCGSCSQMHHGVSHRGDHRAVPARRAPLHRLPDDRAEGLDSRGAAPADRRPRLRLRRMPRCVSVESVRADDAGGAVPGAARGRIRVGRDMLHELLEIRRRNSSGALREVPSCA